MQVTFDLLNPEECASVHQMLAHRHPEACSAIHLAKVARSVRRRNIAPNSGIIHPKARFNADQIRAIRTDPRAHSVIAAEYDMSLGMVWKIKHRYQYAGVPDEATDDEAATPRTNGAIGVPYDMSDA